MIWMDDSVVYQSKPNPPVQPVSGSKESGGGIEINVEMPHSQVLEIRETEPAKEIDSWVQKIEKSDDVQLSNPVLDDSGQVLIQSVAPQQPKIVLPLNEDQLNFGFKQQVVDSIRWLAQWCVRIIKMNPGQVAYKKK